MADVCVSLNSQREHRRITTLTGGTTSPVLS
jgi:hypothetical protein